MLPAEAPTCEFSYDPRELEPIMFTADGGVDLPVREPLGEQSQVAREG